MSGSLMAHLRTALLLLALGAGMCPAHIALPRPQQPHSMGLLQGLAGQPTA